MCFYGFLFAEQRQPFGKYIYRGIPTAKSAFRCTHFNIFSTFAENGVPTASFVSNYEIALYY
jgi:hypothetical protein